MKPRLKKNKLQPKTALLLFSGGLDSILAAKLLEEMKFKVTLLALKSHFFDTKQAEESAKMLNLPLIKKNFSPQHWQMVKSPIYGYGKGLNPCIDCHALMLKEAKAIAKAQEFDLIATGEVLGQRPLSQKKSAFEKIERLAGLENKVFRPLCAGILPPTDYEKRGLVKRKNFSKISGRNRKGQLALVEKFGIKNFPTPAGGCILTEKEFTKRLIALKSKKEILKTTDFELIKFGRHYWQDTAQIILGKNKEENELINQLAEKGDILIERNDRLGPTGLIRFYSERESEKELIRKTKQLIFERSRKKTSASDYQELDFIIKNV